MYQDFWSNSAAKFYEGLNKKEKARVDDAVYAIRVDPVAATGSLALSGELKGKRRIRIGKMRLIYSFDPDVKRVNILTLSFRKDAYR